VAAKYLARPDSKVVTICGCGNQGRISLRALARVLPVERVLACDSDAAQARTFASELGEELSIDVEAVGEVIAGIRPGRTSTEEVIIFDSAGMALQDVVAAAAVYERAVSQGRGTLMNFAEQVSR
jgi:ornithine cyclodeaminase/alanine dehydrogenase-like protein (mu-crystallin family)